MDQENVGKFIAELRKEKKLTQVQLGGKLGVTDKTVSKWEKGITAPSISILNDLSSILGVTTTELLSGERLEEINPQKVDNTIYSNIKFYTKINKKKYLKKVSIFFIGIIVFFLIIIVLLFLNNNYDNCYIYELSSENENFKVNGIISLTTEKDIISINSIENISDYELDNEMIYSYEFSLDINKETIYKEGNISLYEYNKSDQAIYLNEALNKIKIYITENSNYNSVIQDDIFENENIILSINYIDKELIEKEINLNLKLNKVFSNNKMFYDGGNKF